MQDKGNLLLKLTLFVIAAIAIGFFLFTISDIVKLVIIAGLLAYILDPLANIMESRGMSRTSATVAIFVGIVLLSVLSYFIFLPLLSEEIKSLKNGFGPEQTGAMVSRLEEFLATNLSFIGVRDMNITGKLQGAMAHTGEWILAHVMDAASVVTSMILIPFIVFFLLKDGREFKKAFVTLVPNRYFEFTLYLLYKLDTQVGNYLRGQFIDATIIGFLAFFALWFIGIKYYFLIGVFTGFANLIPYFGPITGAMLATFLSILQTGGFEMALYVILAFTVIKLVDDALVQPVVVARSVDMNPLTVLLAILVGGKLFGILGMLLSVPVAGFIKVVVRESIINYRKYRAI